MYCYIGRHRKALYYNRSQSMVITVWGFTRKENYGPKPRLLIYSWGYSLLSEKLFGAGSNLASTVYEEEKCNMMWPFTLQSLHAGS